MPGDAGSTKQGVQKKIHSHSTRRKCTVFDCGSTYLVKLPNYLKQVHCMNIEERAKLLKWGKLEIRVPRHRENRTDHEVTMEKTMKQLLKRLNDMEKKIFKVLKYYKKHNASLKRKRETRKIECLTITL